MNTKNGWEESHVSNNGVHIGLKYLVLKCLITKLHLLQAAFLWVTYGSTAVSVALFLGIILFARWKRLLFIPDASSFGSGSISQ